jgi:hypothetical protein
MFKEISFYKENEINKMQWILVLKKDSKVEQNKILYNEQLVF